MKLKTSLFFLVLVALALLWIPTVTASDPPASQQEVSQQEVSQQEVSWLEVSRLKSVAAPTCSADFIFGEQPTFEVAARAGGGCDTSQCNTSCRAQGFDYGVCFGSTCICRFYFP